MMAIRVVLTMSPVRARPWEDPVLICGDAVAAVGVQPQVDEPVSAVVAEQTLDGLVHDPVPAEPVRVTHTQAHGTLRRCTVSQRGLVCPPIRTGRPYRAHVR